MTTIYYWGCETVLGNVTAGKEKEESLKLKLDLKGKCPKCDRPLWDEAVLRAKPVNGLALRMFT